MFGRVIALPNSPLRGRDDPSSSPSIGCTRWASGSTSGTPRRPAPSPTWRCRSPWSAGRGRRVLPPSLGSDVADLPAIAGLGALRLHLGFCPDEQLAHSQHHCGRSGQTARADRQTEDVRTADHAVDVARARRDGACGPGHGKSVARQTRQAEVTKFEANQTQATAKAVARARAE
jgi:hypothetical protein